MRNRTVFAICVAVLTFTVSGFADVVTGGTAWYSWNQANLNQAKGAGFWDGDSSDSAGGCNIGYWLTNSQVCGTQNPVWGPGTLDFYAGANKNTWTNFTFSQPDAIRSVQLRLEVAGYSGTNTFGWYDVASPNVLNQIFPGSASAVTTWTGSITAGSQGWGYYIQVPQAGNVVYRSGTDGGQFALFSSWPGRAGNTLSKYWIGIEDLNISGGDKDYQDMVVNVQTISLDTNVPEPSAYVVLCVGLGCLVWLVRRQRQSA